MAHSKEHVAEIRKAFQLASPEVGQEAKEGFYNAVCGLMSLKDALEGSESPAIQAELEIVKQAIAIMDKSALGAVL